MRLPFHRHRFEPFLQGSYPPPCHAKCACGEQSHRWRWDDFNEFNEWVADGLIRCHTTCADPIEWVSRDNPYGD